MLIRYATVLALVIAVAGSAVAPLRADEIQIRAVTVSGEGSVNAPPDMAELVAGVQTREATARGAMERNNAAMSKVVEAIRRAGIADKDIETLRVSLSPVFDNAGGQRRQAGYLAANRVMVRLRDLTKVASMLDAVVTAGANDVGGVRFLIADPKPLMDKARREAIADAQRRAKLLADAAGVKLGKVLRIDEAGIRTPQPVFLRAEMAMRSADAPIAPGEQEIQASVTVRFGLE